MADELQSECSVSCMGVIPAGVSHREGTCESSDKGMLYSSLNAI